MKLLTVVGARPQFIKAAMVSRALISNENIKEIIVHTGQHYDINLSDVFFEELGLPDADYNLGVGSGSHGYQTGKMLERIEELIVKVKPDLVLVYGDTNSTLAGALASVKLHIPVAHVEAGLRSFNRKMPEEINRILTDHAADLLFAPTETAVDNLRHEGIPEDRIYLTGDVMFDAALYYAKNTEKSSRILERLNLSRSRYILATIHRAENTDNVLRLKPIMEGLVAAARQIQVILPLHPRTRARLEDHKILKKVGKKLTVTEPLGYLDMVMLEKNAALIATDSGGVQKEAFFHGVPCVTLREETEWIELIESGWNTLCPPFDSVNIEKAILDRVGVKGKSVNLYGGGNASKQIASILINNLGD